VNYEALLKAAKGESRLQTLTPRYIEFKQEGAMVVGKLMHIAVVHSTLSNGTYNQYIFETDGGLVKFQMGGATDNEAGAMLVVGGIYAITFQGQDKLKGAKRVNKFDIQRIVDESNLPLNPAADVAESGDFKAAVPF
jgi:hypothetical protein